MLVLISLVEAKKKKIKLFGKKNHKKKAAATSTTAKPFVAKATSVIAAKVSQISLIRSSIASIRATAKPNYTQKFHNKTNLKLVYKSVIPPGMKRPNDAVVFQYTDNEEGKKCRCVCRMK